MVIFKIPFLDLGRQYRNNKAALDAAIEQVINETAFAGGKFVARFEQAFATFHRVNYCIGVNSGTSALHLAMTALNIGPGDEVIVPANSFISTAWAVSYCGATPVFADCDAFYNIDPAHVESLITKNTKAIIGVHLYGQAFNVDAILALARKYNLALVEDAAQAQGAKWKGERVGSFGDFSCFSFYPGKNLGAFGESGAVCCKNDEQAELLRKLRNHGAAKKYEHELIGYNMRMDGIQGNILLAKLPLLEQWNEARRRIAKRYQTEIAHPGITKPQTRPESEAVFHLFVLKVPERNRFLKYMEEHGITCGLHYPVPCHLQKAYAFLNYKKGSLPNTEQLAAQCVSLPIYPELSHEEVDYIIETVNNYRK